MKNKKEWETKSLEWIHEVREKIDAEITRKGVSPAQWIRDRGKVDVKQLCKKLGLRNYTVVTGRVKRRIYDSERTVGNR
jgi:hypothetical protein